MRFSDKLKERGRFLADTLLPGPYQCFLCDEEAVLGEDGLCDECRQSLRFVPNPVCLQPIDGIAIGIRYSDSVSQAILRFKKNAETDYAPFFAQFLSVPKSWNADLLVPVPMHPFKKWLRRFNHTELLCAYVSHATGIPYSSALLHKVRMTAEQKSLDAPERYRNIRNSFKADPRVKGLRIVLIDDVFTTGATVYECARALKTCGASRVYLSAISSPSR